MNIISDLTDVIKSYYGDIIQILPKLAIGILATAIVYTILSIITRRIVKFLNVKADDKLMVTFMNSVLGITKVLIAILFFLFVIGQGGLASTIFGAATISSVVIGFAFKDIAENFLAGVIMAFNRPFRIGDFVKTGSVEGSIIAMSLRDTHVKTPDGKDVYVPNGQIIKNPLYNYTIDGFLRKSFSIGLDYGTDIDGARKIIQDTMEVTPGVLKEDKLPKTLITEFGASTINVEVQYWLDTFDNSFSGTEVQSQAMKKVLNNLENAGVNLPGDIIELKNYQDQPIKTGAPEIQKTA